MNDIFLNRFFISFDTFEKSQNLMADFNRTNANINNLVVEGLTIVKSRQRAAKIMKYISESSAVV